LKEVSAEGTANPRAKVSVPKEVNVPEAPAGEDNTGATGIPSGGYFLTDVTSKHDVGQTLT